MGRMAAITVSVASTVGFPTSATACTAISRSERRCVSEIPVPDDVLHDDDRVVDEDADGEGQREERDAIERVSQQVEQQEHQGRGSTGMAIATTSDSRHPSMKRTSSETPTTAMAMWSSSSFDFSAADAP